MTKEKLIASREFKHIHHPNATNTASGMLEFQSNI